MIKYRPANGTEDELFMEEFCYSCARDMEDCPILLASEIYNVDNAGYPQEWQYDVNDQPMCTAFEEGE